MPSFSIPSRSSVVSWRTLAILFALLNLKSLPLAWHARLFYRLFQRWYSVTRSQRTINRSPSTELSQNKLRLDHPFHPVSIFSHSPLMEIDYNLHKSNSTYFSDLDESRTALVTQLLAPGMKRGNQNLEAEGHKGPLNVILGAVHTSFHREIRPYERYEVRSRLLGWDKKWLVIGSWFVRPARRGKEEVLLASALSKYVVKKGKFTVAPERCFRSAGLLPPRPVEEEEREISTSLQNPAAEGGPASSEEPSIVPTPQEGLTEPVPGSLVRVTSNIVERLGRATGVEAMDVVPDAGQWDWHRIEKERLRGVQIAADWLSLDKGLMEEFSRT